MTRSSPTRATPITGWTCSAAPGTCGSRWPGETLAETHRPWLLFETGLPTRYYLPKADVRMDLLVPTDRQTQCPYKGRARYWSARVGDRVEGDLAWSYPFPIPECPKIENLVAFYNERADIWVDGELQPKPETPWSRPPTR